MGVRSSINFNKKLINVFYDVYINFNDGGSVSKVGLFGFRKKNSPKGTRKGPYKSKAVVVLGSGRSGTSVLARAINILGVDLGENFIRKNKTNPKGFFEDKKIVETHIELTDSYLPTRPFPKNFQKMKGIRDYRQELKEYVRDNFIDKPIWGWKDPRNNEFLPMWNDILDELHVEGHYLVIIRNPIDVLRSYKRAYNRDQTWARLQWQFRTLIALKETYQRKRIIVEYEQLFSHSLDSVRRIAKTFDFPWPEDETPIKEELDEFIDPNLQRSKSDIDLEEFKKSSEIDQDIKDLYLLCLEGSRTQDYLQTKAFQNRVDKLYAAYLRDHGTKLPCMPPDAKRLKQNKKK